MRAGMWKQSLGVGDKTSTSCLPPLVLYPLISTLWPEPLGPSTHPDALSSRPRPSLVGPMGHSHLPHLLWNLTQLGGGGQGCLSARRLLGSRPLGPEQACPVPQ